MNIVDLSVKRPVLTLMGLLALVIFGVIAYFSLPVSLFPDMSGTVVTIQTVYPGASPQVIETQLTKKLEDQVFSIAEVDSITSYSMDSVSVITVMFKQGKDENVAVQEVKDKVEVIMNQLPSGIEKPAVTKIDLATSFPIMQIVLESTDGSGLTATELATLASTQVRDQIAQVSGVGSVTLSGGAAREIAVELRRSTVFARAVPIEQIAGILASANVELPGGNVDIGKQNIPVRLKGEFSSLEEIDDLDIATSGGIFKLRQLADVKDTHTVVKERTILLDKDAGTRNENAILLSIQKNPSANILDVIDGVVKRIPRIEADAGNTIRLKVIQEDATFARDAVSDTMSNLLMGILFTGLVLFVFLHNIRSTIIVALAMPFSIIATFLVMQPLHIDINVLSLMGLSCATGTLVANSVVVLENIFRYKAQGLSGADAASKGTKEVLVAVFASTLTNVAVFVPLGTTGGGMGQVLSHFALTIVISTVFSIVVSFTLTPLMASRILPAEVKKSGKIGLILEKVFAGWAVAYGTSLKVILGRKWRSGLVVIAVFAAFVLSIMAFRFINFELMAKSDGGKVQVTVELPQGSDLDATARVLAEIESRLASGEYKEETRTILTKLGTAGSMNQDVSVAQMDIVLAPKKERTRSNSDIASAMTATLQDIPGAVIRVLPPSEIAISQGAPIDLLIQGSDNAVLQAISDTFRKRVEEIPGIMNTAVNSKTGKQELVFEPKRKRLSEDGLSVQQVAVSLRAAIDGLVTTTYKEGGEEYDIRVKIADADLFDIEDIRNIPVVTRTGTNPISYYADLRFDTGYNMIMRVNKFRTVELTAELLPGYSMGTMLGEVMKAASDMELPDGYSIKQAGMSEAMGESMLNMLMVFVIAVLLVYMLLAAVLESFTQPLFILATVPLSLIGVIAGCIVTNTVLNVVSMLGIIMLVGIVVNNAILMLDYYNRLKREGRTTSQALIEACPTKLKPILMSNIAIVLGMVPMAAGMGVSMAEIRQPMGVVIIGGIISSTVLTLWLIPAMELLLGRER